MFETEKEKIQKIYDDFTTGWNNAKKDQLFKFNLMLIIKKILTSNIQNIRMSENSYFPLEEFEKIIINQKKKFKKKIF